MARPTSTSRTRPAASRPAPPLTPAGAAVAPPPAGVARARRGRAWAQRPLALVAVALTAFLSLAVLLPALSAPAVVRVHLAASHGDALALYVNGTAEQPRSTPLAAAGVRAVYEFPHRGGDIDFLRLDVEGGQDVAFTVYGVTVERGGDVLARYGYEDIAGWEVHGATPVVSPGRDPGVRLQAEGTDPFLSTVTYVDVTGEIPNALAVAVSDLAEPLNRYVLSLVAVVALLAASARSSFALRSVGVALACAGVTALALVGLLQLPGPLASPDVAVGRATYLGSSIATNTRAVTGALLVGVALAVAFAYATRRRGKAAHGADETQRWEPPRPGRGPLLARIAVVAGVALSVLAVVLPDLRSLASVLVAGGIGRGSNFDAENGFAWIAFADRGLVPMRDFWYPYGNTALFDRDVILGPLLSALVLLMIVTAYGWVLWCLTAGRVVLTALGTLSVLLAQPSLVEFRRYGLALAVALTYVALQYDATPRRLGGRIVFTVMVTLALFMEPVLVAYAATGVVILVVVDLVRVGRAGWGAALRRLAVDLAGPAVAALVWLVVTVRAGQLGHFFEFYTTLSDDATYGATPTDFGGPLALLIAGLQGQVIWFPAMIFGVGLWLRLRARSWPWQAYGAALLVMAGVAAVLAQKHALRPLPTYQLMLFPTTAVLLLLVMVLVVRAQLQRWKLWHGAAVGAAVAALTAMPFLPLLPTALRQLPERAVADADLVAERFSSGFGADRNYSPDRFGTLADEQGVVETLRDRLEPGGDGLFVLGDESSLYVMLDQRPPWQVNIYNTSPIAEQRHVLRELSDEDDEVVVMSRRYLQFDDIPHTVRVPLLYKYVVSRYSLEKRVGDLDVLSTSPTVPAEEYWPEALGSRIDLGYIPAAHSYSQLSTCAPGSAGCAPFLRVTSVRQQVAGELVEVPVRFGETPITLAMRSLGDGGDLVVPLSRTWPYGLSHDVSLVQAPQGWSAEVVHAEQPEDVLY